VKKGGIVGDEIDEILEKITKLSKKFDEEIGKVHEEVGKVREDVQKLNERFGWMDLRLSTLREVASARPAGAIGRSLRLTPRYGMDSGGCNSTRVVRWEESTI
jgi:hypothetical protein